ncbi:MAG: 2-amino-4-hydroxy-6-hydroxymethyldihydropteridine diphosphokinase [Gemmatimonadaceae bacterium]
MPEVAHIALGSNLGDRARHLEFARHAIATLPSCRLMEATVPEETEPFGPPGQGPYLNQMVAIETDLDPHDLLRALQDIEARASRVREQRWGPRTLDLDIVTFGTRTIRDPRLRVPHPGLRDRPFWRSELAQLQARL